jgi:TRAP-type C4-dicarboxylate transport system substrate-binding protein
VTTRLIRIVLIAAAGIVCAAGQLWSQQYIIKFASIAPDGSTWTNMLREYDKAIRAESGGRMGFKIYAGGVQGEDKDVIKKIRLGQLHSAGFTGVGLGEIAPKVRILDSPFLFQNYDEVDYVYSTFSNEFDQAFRDNGFVLLGWSEVGFVYVFTNSPVHSLADMNNVKMWMWEGDVVAEETFKSLGLHPYPLSVVDVLTSLQTGLINGAYISPYAAIAMQWNTRVKYMMSIPLADACGAVVIAKRTFDNLPADLQEILLRNGKKYMGELTKKSRQENSDAIPTMKKNGMQVIEVNSPQILKEYQAAGKRARQALAGKVYDRGFLDRVENSLDEFRKTRGGKK